MILGDKPLISEVVLSQAQATEAVDDELEAPEVNGFDEGENITQQGLTIRSGGER
jgi:hypothetical protein